jgi:hypothetical protein
MRIDLSIENWQKFICTGLKLKATDGKNIKSTSNTHQNVQLIKFNQRPGEQQSREQQSREQQSREQK